MLLLLLGLLVGSAVLVMLEMLVLLVLVLVLPLPLPLVAIILSMLVLMMLLIMMMTMAARRLGRRRTRGVSRKGQQGRGRRPGLTELAQTY